MNTLVQQRTPTLTLRGSAQIVAEAFGYCIESILFQRGVYSQDKFTTTQAYGLTLYQVTDPALRDYLQRSLADVAALLEAGAVHAFIIVLLAPTGETLERWVFNVETSVSGAGGGPGARSADSCRLQIAQLMRQILAMNSFLPPLEYTASFDILLRTSVQAQPAGWAESDAHEIVGPTEEIRLHDFATSFHHVKPSVVFRQNDVDI